MLIIVLTHPQGGMHQVCRSNDIDVDHTMANGAGARRGIGDDLDDRDAGGWQLPASSLKRSAYDRCKTLRASLKTEGAA
jgi:hypothetical protein